MIRTSCTLLTLGCLMLPADGLAQQPPEEVRRDGQKSGTYLKLGLAHWQGDIFSEGSLTRWDVDLFGAEYNLTSLNVEIESYFRNVTLQLSGFSIGYRKDAIRRIDSGHMFSGKLFRAIDVKAIALKAGGGIEWGMPSLNFDRTEFDLAGDGTLRYRHTHPERNVDVPFVGTRTDGALYPFLELSASQRPGALLVEAGMRINFIGFRFDDYEVGTADRVTHIQKREKVMVPYLFMNVGLRLF